MHMNSKAGSWELIGTVLQRAVQNMEAAQDCGFESLHSSIHFNAVRTPRISIADYLLRIHQYANCSDSCFILAFIYLDRLLQSNPEFALSNRSIHRLLLSAVVLAIKYSDDAYADNLTYAKIGGVSLSEMNTLEGEMLKLLQYNLFVDGELFSQYLSELQLQSQKIVGEEVLGEEAMECCKEYSKPIRPISSTTSMKTIASNNDIPYD
eukprot:TRINITY_DN1010_c0_g1_i12.p1 TRINITY_DN1010_c0_g1~~TRINITY_DN1010_c0_g1_i12.p1  ORF type:complete len:208 (+),score=35.06 TRINITY_DN1010_c0_g1_i12:105-728(+)